MTSVETVNRAVIAIGILLVAMIATCFLPFHSSALEMPPLLERLDPQLGGHLRGRGRISNPDDDSIFGAVGSGTYVDGSVEFRLKNRLFFKDWGTLDTHYEAIWSGGDTRRKLGELSDRFPGLVDGGILNVGPIEDDRRALDLSTTITDGDSYVLYHRIDRLYLTVDREWGSLRVGRQAITFGNGLIFNPMDLFNPFAPTDIERDYKVGDDMVLFQRSLGLAGELQLLYVQRRNEDTRKLAWNESSLAGKLHLAGEGGFEADLMMAHHYRDMVYGVGSTGFLRDAAWRMDVTYTDLDNDQSRRDGYFSLVANIDYSWVWWEKNFYGLVEFYFNGLGEKDYPDALENKNLIERLDRGELFTVGRDYLSGTIQIEVHPLVNFFFTAITNTRDPSGVLQPRIVWDMTQDTQWTLGSTINYGESGTEFGGFRIPGTAFDLTPVDSGFVWLTIFF